jgi:hypothetical protein
VNAGLARLAASIGLEQAANETLRLSFGLACAERVQHLVEESGALTCLAVLRSFVDGRADRAALLQAASEIAAMANRHRGSNSIDGTAHAAVSATYALANALAGRALEAAAYAAYATVYAYGGYAVNDPSAFEAEFEWQTGKLRELSLRSTAGA